MHKADLAQLVERKALNLVVMGSSPMAGAILVSMLDSRFLFFVPCLLSAFYNRFFFHQKLKNEVLSIFLILNLAMNLEGHNSTTLYNAYTLD